MRACSASTRLLIRCSRTARSRFIGACCGCRCRLQAFAVAPLLVCAQVVPFVDAPAGRRRVPRLGLSVDGFVEALLWPVASVLLLPQRAPPTRRAGPSEHGNASHIDAPSTLRSRMTRHCMTEHQERRTVVANFRLRVAAAALFVLICFGLLGLRFLYLQVWHYSKYSLQADENRISVAPVVPNRGIITDRNGIVLANNYSAYTLEITPSKVDGTSTTHRQARAGHRHRRRAIASASRSCSRSRKNFESLPIRTA